MGKEARINAKIKAERDATVRSLFGQVVVRIVLNNPGFNGEVFSSTDLSLGLYDGRELDVFIRELCMMGRAVNIFHATYGINEAGDMENRHLCALHTPDLPFNSKEDRKRLYMYQPYPDRRKGRLYALLGNVEPALDGDGMITLAYSSKASLFVNNTGDES
ncbi:hypothetical protein HF563_14570 [Acidithiobacillus ferridurans]|nr:hypothetical protein [Acidithiobacillus ferridurans]